MMKTATRTTLSASTLTGNSVKNPAGEDLGTVKDIMLDVDLGRVAYAVVSFGGFLGFGDKLFAVPWNALRLDTVNHAFVLDVPKRTLENAEGFNKDDWPDMADPAWGQRIHQYYGTEAYWE
jgi:sporulation protein YlmC with PRC-barrel domain